MFRLGGASKALEENHQSVTETITLIIMQIIDQLLHKVSLKRNNLHTQYYTGSDIAIEV